MIGKEFLNQVYLVIFWPQKRKRILEARRPFAHDRKLRLTYLFAVLFTGPGRRAPPPSNDCGKLGAATVKVVAVFAFVATFRTFLWQKKRDGIPFTGHALIFIPQNGPHSSHEDSYRKRSERSQVTRNQLSREVYLH